MPAFGAPLANLGMSIVKPLIWTEVNGSHDTTGGQFRVVNALIANKRFRDLGPDLNQPAVQVERNMSAWTPQTGGADKRPDLAARSGNKLR